MADKAAADEAKARGNAFFKKKEYESGKSSIFTVAFTVKPLKFGGPHFSRTFIVTHFPPFISSNPRFFYFELLF